MAPPPASPARLSIASTFGWGVFCACSWTWCIGMFLPVVMISRWGWAGFLAFAVPNVLGCAAFGYVLRDRERASRLTIEHAGAMRLFSIITLAYHVFFIGFIAWLLAPVNEEHGRTLAILAPIALLSISALISSLPDRTWPIVALCVYAFSLAVFATIGQQPLSEIPPAREELLATAGGLIWLVPALTFGFLLCPYLDLTFHRALQRSPSRHSFAVFGMSFAVMIVMTAAYWDALERGLSWIVLAHIAAQSIFTMAAHQRELLAEAPSGDRSPTGRGTARLAALVVPLLALPLAFLGAFHADAVEGSVDIYIRFLVFYGLAFPAYVLLFLSPWRTMRLRRPDLVMFVLAILAGAALYELAFIRDCTWLAVLPPVAVVLWTVLRNPGSRPPVDDR